LAVVVACIISRCKHKRRVNLFYKTIPDETVNRSIALIMVAIAIIGLILFLVLVTNDDAHIQTDRPFLACLFETVSAFGTVGLSMGITAGLSEWGKIWLIVMMIIGRIGVLSFVYLVAGTSQSTSIEYAEENVMIG
jgi:trk system potassium uptake protein